MAHGAAAAGGSTYYADLVADSLAADRASSSSRDDRRSTSAARRGAWCGCWPRRFPELEWHGCDPIPDAIEWARANLPGIAFERSPEYPPLPYDDAAVRLRLRDLDLEPLRRAARRSTGCARCGASSGPAGGSLLTTHGEQTIGTPPAPGRPLARAARARCGAALYEHGFWYAAEFGEAGDHGVANPDWGTAFLTPEWLLAKLTPEWRVALFRPGRVEGNQDLYVLERR